MLAVTTKSLFKANCKAIVVLAAIAANPQEEIGVTWLAPLRRLLLGTEPTTVAQGCCHRVT